MLEDAWASYHRLTRDYLGFTGLRLRRPVWDKFAGSEHTDVLDTIMPCGRVLQTVGAHYLGQKFAKAFEIKFLNQANQLEFAYMTCFGISTRILAAALAAHGDEKGLVLPPLIAKYQVIIVPILGGAKLKEKNDQVLLKVKELSAALEASGIRTHIDASSMRPGDKFYFWEMKGVPLRMEVGPRDLDNKQVVLVRRDTGSKSVVPEANAIAQVKAQLDALLAHLRSAAFGFHTAHITTCNSIEEISAVMQGVGGFARVPLHSCDMDAGPSDKILRDKTGGEVRGFIPSEPAPPQGTKCVVTGQPAKVYVYVARAY